MSKTLLMLNGDGIGKEVVPVAARLIQALLPDLSLINGDAGYEAYLRHGKSLPDETLDYLDEVDGVLFGATSTPSPRPEGYESAILGLRSRLAASVNMRRCRCPGGSPMDVMIFRETSEGLYSGREHAIEDGASADYIVTRHASEKVARAAAAYARDIDASVTVVHKANVLPKTDGLFLRVGQEVCEAEGVPWTQAHADIAGYFLVKEPQRYRVLMTNSHVGDILADVAAGIVGSMGWIPSLAVGGRTPLAEPVHGSAPDIVGKGIADPVGTILSGAMLIGALGYKEESELLTQAVEQHLLSRPPSAEVRTMDVEKAILAKL